MKGNSDVAMAQCGGKEGPLEAMDSVKGKEF
jgi:hypothetical protein